MAHEETAMALKRSRHMNGVMRCTSHDATAEQRADQGVIHSGEQHGIRMLSRRPVPSFPPPELDWKSLHTAGDCTLIDSQDSNSVHFQNHRLQDGQGVPSGLFLNTSYQNRSHSLTYSDGDDDDSPVRPNVARTRLDFNLTQAIPTEDLDSTPTDKPFDVFKPVTNESRGPSQGTPPKSSDAAALMDQVRPDFSSSSILEWPASPAEAQFRFRLDAAQCSPILPTGMPGSNLNFHHTSPSPDQSSPAPDSQAISSSAINTHGNILSQDNSNLSLSHDSSSSSHGSKQRRLRPMPDMSAFDAGASIRSGSSSLNTKSCADDSCPSPKLACPPTPLRTPAWAHHDGSSHPFVRTNSLIVTRVLATCPVQVLDGHSSLENSMDLSGAGDIEKRRASLSFSTVEEERGDEVMEDAEGTESVLDVALGITPPPRMNGVPVSIPRFSLSPDPRNELGMNQKAPLAARLSHPTQSTVNVSVEESPISFATSFENLGELGCGAFGDVYKVRSKADGQLYAVKRNRRQFRGKRDRNMAMLEVRTMQKLQSVCANGANKSKSSYSLYLLFFYRAWQEEGFFYCQTELCCRDTCRNLMDSLRSKWPSTVIEHPLLMKYFTSSSSQRNNNDNDSVALGRLMPDRTVWKICHDVAAGLSHIHSHGIVHHDIKPSNIFFVSHARLGAMCKIGDFGIAGEIGTAEDGQEGDTVYMAPELLSSSVKHPSADIFSLGLTLYELASDIGWLMPVEGPRWHEVRGGLHVPELPSSRHSDLGRLIQASICADRTKRPSADDILKGLSLVKEAGSQCDEFLRDYILDIERNDRERAEREALLVQPEQTPRTMEQRALRTPTPGIPAVPLLFTPNP